MITRWRCSTAAPCHFQSVVVPRQSLSVLGWGADEPTQRRRCRRRCQRQRPPQAYVSRTEYPERAVPCLKTFQITETKTMFDIGVYQVSRLL